MRPNEERRPDAAGHEAGPGLDAAEALLLQSPVATALLGPDLRFRVANPAWCLLADRHAFSGERWDDVFPALAATSVPALLHEVLEDGRSRVAREIVLALRRHGRPPQDCCFRLHVDALRDTAGHITGLMPVSYTHLTLPTN